MPKTFQQSPRVDDWTVTTLPAGATTYTISGTITSSGTGVAGVRVALTGKASKIMITGTSGAYSFGGLEAGTYTVTPTKDGSVFEPKSRTVVLTNENVENQDFVEATTEVLNNAAIHRAAIYEVKAAKITALDVTITWRTNIPAASMVEYGLTPEYGMKSGVNTEMRYRHDIQLFGLQKGAVYHARAVSYPAEGPALYSADFTFKVPSSEDRISERKYIFHEPSPATSWVIFSYLLYQPAKSVTIDILTLSGKHLATLESPSSALSEGWNKVRWDNINLDNGVYMYKVKIKTITNMEEEYRFSTLRVVK